MGSEVVVVDDFGCEDVYLEGLCKVLVEIAVNEYLGFVLLKDGEYLLY